MCKDKISRGRGSIICSGGRALIAHTQRARRLPALFVRALTAKGPLVTARRRNSREASRARACTSLLFDRARASCVRPSFSRLSRPSYTAIPDRARGFRGIVSPLFRARPISRVTRLCDASVTGFSCLIANYRTIRG